MKKTKKKLLAQVPRLDQIWNMFADINSIDVNGTDIYRKKDTQRGGSAMLTMQFKSLTCTNKTCFI